MSDGLTYMGEPVALTRLALRPGDVLVVRLQRDDWTVEQLDLFSAWLVSSLQGWGYANQVMVLPQSDVSVVEPTLSDAALAARVNDLKRKGLIW